MTINVKAYSNKLYAKHQEKSFDIIMFFCSSKFLISYIYILRQNKMKFNTTEKNLYQNDYSETSTRLTGNKNIFFCHLLNGFCSSIVVIFFFFRLFFLLKINRNIKTISVLVDTSKKLRWKYNIK